MSRHRTDRERKAMFANMGSSGHKQGMNINQQVIKQPERNLSRKVVVKSKDGQFIGSKSFRLFGSEPSVTKKPFGSSHNTGHIDKPKLSKTKREFISKEIRRQRREGKPAKQSIAIAFSKARKKFGNSALRQMPSNPNNDNKEQKRIRRLLVSLFGLAITLEVLRRVRLQSSHKSGHTDNDKQSGHLTVIQNKKVFSKVLDDSIDFNEGLATSQRIDRQKNFPSSKQLLDENKEIKRVKNKIDTGRGLNKKEIKIILRESTGKLGNLNQPIKFITNRKALNEVDELRQRI